MGRRKPPSARRANCPDQRPWGLVAPLTQGYPLGTNVQAICGCASLDGKRQLDDNLLSFIWRHSAGQQLLLLALTAASFPILYVSLEIRKFIINGVIQGHDFPRRVLGMELGQTAFLWLLCLGFLACVFANGVIKMQLSIYRGIDRESG